MAVEPLMQTQRRAELEALLQELCTAETLNGRYLLQMPVAMACGSTVSVSIWPEGGGSSFMVSDDGLALHEVNIALASDKIFARVAAARSSRYGAEFDGGTMLFMRVEKSRLKGAVVAMASLIKEVVDETIEKSFAAKIDKAQERFIERATEAFREFNRKEHASVIGQSTAAYEIDLLVETESKVIAFDYFSKAGNSVNSAYVALSDIGRLNDGPTPVGVTGNLRDVGPKLVLITSVAQVIEASAAVSEYKRLAA